jgi:hypothetical protein
MILENMGALQIQTILLVMERELKVNLYQKIKLEVKMLNLLDLNKMGWMNLEMLETQKIN